VTGERTCRPMQRWLLAAAAAAAAASVALHGSYLTQSRSNADANVTI